MWLPRFVQKANSDAKYYVKREKEQEKAEVHTCKVSEYYSVEPDIASSGLMDGE